MADTMTPDEFHEARKTMGWSRPLLADWFEIDGKIVQRMEYGKREIPAEVATWLRRAVRWLENNPPPNEWRKR